MWDMSLNSSALLELADDYDDSAWHQRVVNGTVVTVNETVKKVTLEGVQSVYQVRRLPSFLWFLSCYFSLSGKSFKL